VSAADVDRLARAYLLHARIPGDPAVTELVTQHGPAVTAQHMVSAHLGGKWDREATAAVEHSRTLRLVVPGDDDWPAALTGLASPLGLWVRGGGKLDRLGARAIAIVGSREATAYASRAACELGRELPRAGWTVVTLGRFGVDGAALRGTQQADAPALVLPLGRLVSARPAGHRELFRRLAYRGLLVSEHGLRVPGPHADGRRQSRLLAALAAAVVVVEPDPPGLASGCINAATKAGRPVLAIPGPVDSRAYGYTHHLIRAGRTRLVSGTDDILADLK
jgi:DNA processing protein